MSSEGWTASEIEFAALQEALASAHRALITEASLFNPAVWTTAADSQTWSAAQIVEHIFLAEDLLCQQIGAHLEDQPRPDITAGMAGQREMLLRILPGAGKARAGPRSTAFSGLGWGEVEKGLVTAKAKYEELLVAAREKPIKAIAWTSPFFGELSAELWMLYVPLHTQRHVSQLKRLRTLLTR